MDTAVVKGYNCTSNPDMRAMHGDIRINDINNNYYFQANSQLTYLIVAQRSTKMPVLRRCEIDKSALAEHAWNEGHPVAWDKATILDKDGMRMRLVIKEALHISSNKGTLMNRDTGLELPGCWLATLSHHHSTRMLTS